MKHISILFALIIISITIYGCGSEPYCGEVDNAYTTVLPCYVYDKNTNASVMRSFGAAFDNSFSSLVDENGEDALTKGMIHNNGEMDIPIAYYGKDSIGITTLKTFYLHLVDPFHVEQDIDTIKFSYELYNAPNCHMIDFKDFKCYFNDRLYLTEYPWDSYATFFYK